MTIEFSEPQPRKCPNCGAKVSAHARTCLICGADLRPSTTPPPAPIVEEPVSRRLGWRVAAIAVGLVIILLAAGMLFLRPQATAVLITPAQTATLQETATETNTPRPASPTTTPTASRAPTQAPSTPVPPTKYTVRSGDNLGSIAAKFNTTVEVLQSFNGLGKSDVIQVGQVLQIPSAGSTPNPTTTAAPTETFVPGPTPGTVLHVVQSGDTLLGISIKYGISMLLIQKANDIQDAESIRAGQQLVIPIGPTVTPTTGPKPTATGLPKYPAPILLSPMNNQVFEGNENAILLQWASVAILRENERYLVRIEHVDGDEARTFATQATGWHVPADLFPKPGDPSRTLKWYVRVVRISGQHPDGSDLYSDAGAASAPRTFQWLTAQPTQTPTPGPAS